MTRDEFLKNLEDTYAECLEIVKKKNQDYAKGDDPFANFRLSELISVPVQIGIMVRIMDKLARIGNLFSKRNAVVDESIEDSLNDAINYLAILKAYIKDGNLKKLA